MFPGGSNHERSSEPFLPVGLVCWIMFETGHGARLVMIEVQSAAVCRSGDRRHGVSLVCVAGAALPPGMGVRAESSQALRLHHHQRVLFAHRMDPLGCGCRERDPSVWLPERRSNTRITCFQDAWKGLKSTLKLESPRLSF